ncbi:hypothetical protein CDAR_246871 [Caerostris darwini]|uniref:Uncharacterized protein n=1 Tax=Caerostris darwini TaxID=1538125 RepID=A0AAV4UF28_9ARAC|nr:hypothetical protein CDAR_246871 [Caerostris darwini]
MFVTLLATSSRCIHCDIYGSVVHCSALMETNARGQVFGYLADTHQTADKNSDDKGGRDTERPDGDECPRPTFVHLAATRQMTDRNSDDRGERDSRVIHNKTTRGLFSLLSFYHGRSGFQWDGCLVIYWERLSLMITGDMDHVDFEMNGYVAIFLQVIRVIPTLLC